MPELTHTPISQKLTAADREAIVALLLEGRRISEVVAHGLTRQPGWRRQHVVDLVAANGWTLDSDGRVPKGTRTAVAVPTGPIVPGGPVPEPPREPVADWPERNSRIQAVPVIPLRPAGTRQSLAPAPAGADPHRTGQVTPRPPGPSTAEQAIAAGKAHADAKVRHRAQRAEDALDALLELLREDAKTTRIRRRLAELDAEREKLLAQLGGKPRTKKTPAATGTRVHTFTANAGAETAELGELLPAGTSEANGGKPINHGGWGGFQAHRKRGEDACPDCQTGMETHMDTMRAKSPKGGKYRTETAGA